MNSIRAVMRRGMLGAVLLACAVATAGAQAQRDSSDVPDKWFGIGAKSPTAWLEAGLGFGAALSPDRYAGETGFGARIGVGARIGPAVVVEVSAIGSSPLEFGPSGVNLIDCIDPVTHQVVGCPYATPFQISGVAVSAVRMDDRAPGTRLSLGAGSYTLSRYISNGSSARALGVEAGVDVELVDLRPALTVGVHPVFLPNVRGRHEWYLPLDVGILLW